MKKVRFVGDIHGQLGVLEQALDFDGKVVFVGDFVDSFRKSPEDQYKCVKMVCEEIANGDVEAVFGNHELSYIYPQKMACSGWNGRMQTYFDHELRDLVLKHFKPFTVVEGILVTHAGLTKQLWEDQHLTLENFPKVLTEWWEDHYSPFFQVGATRGGMWEFGGPLWCDQREFKAVPGLRQIFGHSRGNEFRQWGTPAEDSESVCIDVLENVAPKFLDMEFE